MIQGFFASSEVISNPVSGLLPRCGSCGLYKKCHSPKMRPYGKGRKGVLVVGEAPGATEDEQGRPFIGKAGQLLRSVFEEIGVDLDRDCVTTNAIICRPPGNRTPTQQEIEYCRPNLSRVLERFNPRVVIALGRSAVTSVLQPYWSDVQNLERWVGWRIPLEQFWVCPTYHPSFLLRNDDPMLRRLFREHLEAAFSLDTPPCPLQTDGKIQILYEEAEIISKLREMDRKGGWVAVDYETNCLKPEWPEARVVSFSVSDGEVAVSFPWTPRVRSAVGRFLVSPRTKKIASNLKMEERWTWKEFGHGVSNWGWDTMLAAHCLDNRPGICSLKFQAFVRLGVPVYNARVEPFLQQHRGPYNRIHEVEMETLLRYGGMDSFLEWHLAKLQRAEFDPFRLQGYRLLHQGLVALSRVEMNGMRVDTNRLQQSRSELERRIRDIEAKLTSDPLWSRWKRRFGERANLRSRFQIGEVLEKELGISIPVRTSTGKASTHEEVLSKIDHPFVRIWLQLARYDKIHGTFLKGIEKETANGRLHPVFSLHTARTFRSSSDSPNFQNLPVRDKEAGQIVRQLLVPSPGCWIVENDFKAIEVAISACYHKDPNFISYITTPGKDMHRDMAAELFLCKPEQVTKEMRYAAKNKFVFPQFYGDFYVSCARSLWEYASEIQAPDGRPLLDWLRRKGIRGLGDCDPEKKPRFRTFEFHVCKIERKFWDEWFPGYSRWKREWYRQYLQTGKFHLLTGFEVRGVYPRNAVVNYPIQGTAFHCLLWTLIQVQKEIERRGLHSKIIGQIHDSLIADVPSEELLEYLSIVREVATERIRERFEWLIVPLGIEYELARKSWFDKRPVEFDGKQILYEGKPRTVRELEEIYGAL